MADAANVQITFNGSRKAIYKLTSVSDGTGETLVKKVNMADLADPHYGTPSEVLIKTIEYDVYGMAVSLYWEGSPNQIIASLEGHDTMEFGKLGFLKNNATAQTGNILLSTVGQKADAMYSIILELIEHYASEPGIS